MERRITDWLYALATQVTTYSKGHKDIDTIFYTTCSIVLKNKQLNK